MSSNSRVNLALPLIGLIAMSALQDGGKPKNPAEPKQPEITLELIKNLKGDWAPLLPDGTISKQVQNSFRITAGGSAVIETIFPGSPKEMVTVYTQDAKNLVLTHYCVLGNQPSLRLSAKSKVTKLIFECVGGGNIKTCKEEHMHHATFYLVDKDHLNIKWLLFDKGKSVYTAASQLVRMNAGAK